MLEGVKAEISEVGRFRMAEDTKDASLLVDVMERWLAATAVCFSHWTDGSFQKGK